MHENQSLRQNNFFVKIRYFTVVVLHQCRSVLSNTALFCLGWNMKFSTINLYPIVKGIQEP